MRRLCFAAAIFLLWFATISFSQTRQPVPPASTNIKVTLLGTASGPPVRLNRYQMSTLVEAGGERLLFDCGRGTTLRLAQAGVPIGEVSKIFLTHLHSDHIVDIPDLYLSGWTSRNQRKQPIEVWGPTGTRSMMDYLQKAYAFDIHIRRDVDEHFSAEGIEVISHDIQEGVVYDQDGVKVTAFLVDHGPVKPAFGYRVDYAGHSVAISGDTRPSDNLVRYSKGVDVLIHETLPGNRASFTSREPLTPAQVEAIIAHHTTPEQAGEIFTRVKPRLAVFSHYPDSPDIIATARKTYSGPLELGQDLMTIEIGDKIEIGRAGTQQPASPSGPQAAAAPAATPSADQPQLSAQQKAEAARIIVGARERGKAIADRLAANAKLFDEVLFGEKVDVDADANAAEQIKSAICDASATRLQAARQVVHLLTPEQRRYLKNEMAKPDSEHGILEAAVKVFHIKIED